MKEYIVNYPVAFHTVDIAPIKKEGGDWWVLMGRKLENRKFQFIGGFVDPTDGNIEEAAMREMIEEAGWFLWNVGKLDYIGSAKIKDERYISSPHKIITSFFKYEIVEPDVQIWTDEVPGSDDLVGLQWFKLDELEKRTVVSKHLILVELLKKSMLIN